MKGEKEKEGEKERRTKRQRQRRRTDRTGAERTATRNGQAIANSDLQVGFLDEDP